MAFGIEHGYRENPGPVYFLDDVTTERGVVFQPDVYTIAELFAAQRDQLHETVIVDVGCGWAEKLAAMHERHPEWRYVAFDYGANIDHCRARWGDNWCDWRTLDFEHATREDFPRADVVICSDVIEHLVDPLALVASFAGSELLADALFVISTPARELQEFGRHGPPQNLCHVREWTGAELQVWLESEWLEVVHRGLTRGSDQSAVMATTLILARQAT